MISANDRAKVIMEMIQYGAKNGFSQKEIDVRVASAHKIMDRGTEVEFNSKTGQMRIEVNDHELEHLKEIKKECDNSGLQIDKMEDFTGTREQAEKVMEIIKSKPSLKNDGVQEELLDILAGLTSIADKILKGEKDFEKKEKNPAAITPEEKEDFKKKDRMAIDILTNGPWWVIGVLSMMEPEVKEDGERVPGMTYDEARALLNLSPSGAMAREMWDKGCKRDVQKAIHVFEKGEF